jgi:hypothetical protein
MSAAGGEHQPLPSEGLGAAVTVRALDEIVKPFLQAVERDGLSVAVPALEPFLSRFFDGARQAGRKQDSSADQGTPANRHAADSGDGTLSLTTLVNLLGSVATALTATHRHGAKDSHTSAPPDQIVEMVGPLALVGAVDGALLTQATEDSTTAALPTVAGDTLLISQASLALSNADAGAANEAAAVTAAQPPTSGDQSPRPVAGTAVQTLLGPALPEGPAAPAPGIRSIRLAEKTEAAQPILHALATVMAEGEHRRERAEAAPEQPPGLTAAVTEDNAAPTTQEPSLANSPPPAAAVAVVVEAGVRAAAAVPSAPLSGEAVRPRLPWLPALPPALTDTGREDIAPAAPAALVPVLGEGLAEPDRVPPQGAGLVGAGTPADPAALQQALEEFLGRVDAVGQDVTGALTANPWVAWGIAFALSAAALEVGRRRLRARGRRGAHEDEADPPPLSLATGSWPFGSDEA